VETKDYRNTKYCPVLEQVGRKKRLLEEKIKKDSPKTTILYNKVRLRQGIYHKEFAKIYNEKCAYCGCMWGILPTESFEVDHFVNEAAYPNTKEGRAEAGRMENLVWSCFTCNRGKHDMLIEPPYDMILNVDNGNIAKVFVRDEDYSIKIEDTYKNDKFVLSFYKALHLEYEARRLDYLALKLQGKYKNEADPARKQKLGEALYLLIEKRNTFVEGRK
jgi:5-methylcytosine-specific restriction endonuclease McrA